MKYILIKSAVVYCLLAFSSDSLAAGTQYDPYEACARTAQRAPYDFSACDGEALVESTAVLSLGTSLCFDNGNENELHNNILATGSLFFRIGRFLGLI